MAISLKDKVVLVIGASSGIATAVAYGVMVFVASLPGAAVLVAGWVRRAPSERGREWPPARGVRVLACQDAEGGSHF